MGNNIIPIKNLYYLLCYAWGHLEQASLVDASDADCDNVEDLLGFVLKKGLDRLKKQGFDRSYVAHQVELAGIRGRVDIMSSASKMLLQHGRTICHVDDLAPDTLPNQILKSTIKKLIGVKTLNQSLRHNLWGHYYKLDGIKEIALSGSVFRRVQLHSNNRF